MSTSSSSPSRLFSFFPSSHHLPIPPPSRFLLFLVSSVLTSPSPLLFCSLSLSLSHAFPNPSRTVEYLHLSRYRLFQLSPLPPSPRLSLFSLSFLLSLLPPFVSELHTLFCFSSLLFCCPAVPLSPHLHFRSSFPFVIVFSGCLCPFVRLCSCYLAVPTPACPVELYIISLYSAFVVLLLSSVPRRMLQ